MAEPLDEIHPGEILLEGSMKPMDITVRQLLADIDVSPPAASANSSTAAAPSRLIPRCAWVSTSAWTRGSG